MKEGFSFAFGAMLGDIGSWLLIGIGVAGTVSFFVPAAFFEHHMKGELTSLVMMLAFGIPLYICATASTPIAAALVLKGLSPGAALVLLLAGPATNAATLTVVAKVMGKKAALLYVAAISICSLALGWTVNQIYKISGTGTHHWMHGTGEHGMGTASIAMSILLLVLILRSFIPKLKANESGCGCKATTTPSALTE